MLWYVALHNDINLLFPLCTGRVRVYYDIRGTTLTGVSTAAKENEDFNSTVNSSVIIPDGVDTATIHINVIDENIPEQDEALIVNITKVELMNGTNSSSPPKIGTSRTLSIIIPANDGTQGELVFAPGSER